MTQEDRKHADNRVNTAARAANDAKSSKAERDAALKAVTDNMAKLKALRLAREAAEPARPAAASKKVTRAKPKKSGEKSPALSDWLAGQQKGGHRT